MSDSLSPSGHQSIRSLVGIGPAVAAKLSKLGVETVDDLLWHLPRTWIDLTKPVPISALRRDELGVIQATVRGPRVERTRRRNMTVLRAELEDAEGNQIAAVWYNQPFLVTKLMDGSRWTFWGTVAFDFSKRQLQLASPKFVHSTSILAVYPETEGITSARLRGLIEPLLATLPDNDYLPEDLRIKYQLLQRPDAVRAIHAPVDSRALIQARQRLALDELVQLVTIIESRRAQRQSGQAPVIPLPLEAIQALIASLPFTLTNAQRRATWQILNDLAKPTAMARLLIGDVGSGKTVVALMAAYAALVAGYQVAWLAPTQLLAEQHVATATRLLQPFGITPTLVTAATKSTEGQLLIGTHAILSRTDRLTNLGLVIIDEQQRFGVRQRQQLLNLATASGRPHLLSMTATPIPRSLALTIFGDLDCSFLDELPSGRKAIATRVIEPANRDQAYDVVVRELAAGRQAYVICPFINEPDATGQLTLTSEANAVTDRYEAIVADPRFRGFKVDLLHGKLDAQTKQATMAAFVQNDLQLLVATSLIEVGIDVPNATVMVVEGAERFGLAQLHQLRGRIGRGDKQSLCIAIASEWSPVSRQRLEAFAGSTDGFHLAELDLKLRGPGDLLGDLQAGLPPLKLARLTDTLNVDTARLIARELIIRSATDSGLAATLASWQEEEHGGGSRLD